MSDIQAMPPKSGTRLPVVAGAWLGAMLALSGCSTQIPEGSMVLTQRPHEAPATDQPLNILDQRYPTGSRVVIASPPFRPTDVRVLSKGLAAAGDPVVCFTGKRLFFAGKKTENDVWQIYETKLPRGRPKARTSMPGGAMDPAIIATGDLVFSSPIPEAGQTWNAAKPAALFVQDQREAPRQLTFSTSAAVQPTVLSDGRILFVSARPANSAASEPALFTINNDGTELTAFALAGQNSLQVRRPRELFDGRIGFLTSATDECQNTMAETVLAARPFASRTALFPFERRVHSVEPDGAGALLACLEKQEGGASAVYRISACASPVGEPLFEDPDWRQIEASSVGARAKPMGRVSTVTPAKSTGILLGLNANFTRLRPTDGEQPAQAERVRFMTSTESGQTQLLGEVPLQPDGSFMVKVPADTPIGLESLDAEGEVLYRLPPMLWVRPGENRSCVGCHEPYNRSPRNQRPMAVEVPPVTLSLSPQTIAHNSLP
jgi:hypothetical protein